MCGYLALWYGVLFLACNIRYYEPCMVIIQVFQFSPYYRFAL